MTALNPTEREELRHIVLEVVYARPGPVLSTRAVTRQAARSSAFAIDECAVLRELDLLKDQGLVTSVIDDLGSSLYWKITAAGTLRYERGQ
jgi:Fe2+ or Zn2+ uptake regulation protein